ncbi:S1 family peptidase [Paraoerskovia marina]|uniref:S1 family peptidase n=1 Tax=Paraoerskovia marina TaxID=545619 RepID=UPI000492AF07|nr:serine protease [Paraoerskovia marina]
MTRRRTLVASTMMLGLLAGCSGTLPPLPDPVPAATDLVPDDPSPQVPDGVDDLTTDGSAAVRSMAVRIRNVQCDGLSTGSGFALDEHTLLTNKHVVADSSEIQLSTYDGRDVAVEGASSARIADLAVIRTTEALPSYPKLALSDPAPGDTVTVVGYPEGGRLTITQGEVVGTTKDPLNSTLGEVLVTDAEVEPGSSGSAALDDDGNVIGVVYAKTASDQSLLVPVSTVQALLEDDGAFAPVASCS